VNSAAELDEATKQIPSLFKPLASARSVAAEEVLCRPSLKFLVSILSKLVNLAISWRFSCDTAGEAFILPDYAGNVWRIGE
jgi:hypothetical protein